MRIIGTISLVYIYCQSKRIWKHFYDILPWLTIHIRTPSGAWQWTTWEIQCHFIFCFNISLGHPSKCYFSVQCFSDLYGNSGGVCSNLCRRCCLSFRCTRVKQIKNLFFEYLSIFSKWSSKSLISIYNIRKIVFINQQHNILFTSINDTLIKNSVESVVALILSNMVSITLGIIPPLLTSSL